MSSVAAYSVKSDCQVIYLSSANTGEQKKCQLSKLENKKGVFYNVVSYVCSEHAPLLQKYSKATMCPCYVFVPLHITLTEDHKETFDAIQENSFFNEILGGGTKPVTNTTLGNTIISSESLDTLCHMRLDSRTLLNQLGSSLFLYIDPAYTANDCHASGVGMCVIARFGQHEGIVLGCEHYFLTQADLLNVNDVIAGIAAHLITNICQLHLDARDSSSSHFKNIYYAVESNISEANAVQICMKIKTKFNFLCTTVRRPCLKTFCRFSEDKLTKKYGLQLNARHKMQFCETTLSLINGKHIKISTCLMSMSLGDNAVDALCFQLKNIKAEKTTTGHIKFSGKQLHIQDDLFISFCMSLGLMWNEHNVDIAKSWFQV